MITALQKSEYNKLKREDLLHIHKQHLDDEFSDQLELLVLILHIVQTQSTVPVYVVKCFWFCLFFTTIRLK